MIPSPDELRLNELVLKNPKLFSETIVRAVFCNPYKSFYKDVIWNEHWNSISRENQIKAEKVCHFYYYMCLPFEESWNIPDAKRLVFTASIMEDLMSEVEHKNFYMFLKSKKAENISKDELNEFWKDYLEIHGSSKKIRHYFENYFLEEDLIWLRPAIKRKKKRKKNGKFLELKNNKELADFFYNLRSEVVHKAKLFTISNEVIDLIKFDLRDKDYKLELSIYNYYLVSFEKSLVKYFFNFSNEK